LKFSFIYLLGSKYLNIVNAYTSLSLYLINESNLFDFYNIFLVTDLHILEVADEGSYLNC